MVIRKYDLPCYDCRKSFIERPQLLRKMELPNCSHIQLLLGISKTKLFIGLGVITVLRQCAILIVF